jgi:hypothetical protein
MVLGFPTETWEASFLGHTDSFWHFDLSHLRFFRSSNRRRTSHRPNLDRFKKIFKSNAQALLMNGYFAEVDHQTDPDGLNQVCVGFMTQLPQELAVSGPCELKLTCELLQGRLSM